MSAALKLAPAPDAKREIELAPDIEGPLAVKSAREFAGRKFIELGEKILSGELAGGACEWRDNSWLEEEAGRDTKIAFSTLTPQTDESWSKGVVQLQVRTLVEEI